VRRSALRFASANARRASPHQDIARFFGEVRNEE
jgi:hypothetical protein